MRLLVPDRPDQRGELDGPQLDVLIGAEARGGPGRPWVMTNMVASLDGVISIDGVSAGLGGPGDRAVFTALRAQADVIVAGAGTVRAERYRMPRPPEGHLAEQRRRRGQAGAPALAVVSGSLDLDGAPFLETADPTRCFVVTTASAPAERRRALEDRCTLVTAGTDHVDAAAAVDALWAHGLRVMLCEGGPRLLSDLARADVIDEWSQTIAPVVIGDDAPHMVQGPVEPRAWVLDRLLGDGAHLIARYLRPPPD